VKVVENGREKNKILISEESEREILGEEMFSLFQKMEKDKITDGTRNEIVERNLGLIEKIADHYETFIRNPSISKDDLSQAGAIGLMRAVEKFDKSRGYRFSTYAVHWIKAFVIGCLMDNGSPIGIPRYLSQEINRLRKNKGKLSSKLLREPDREELAEFMGWKESQLKNVLDGIRSRQIVSLDSPVNASKANREKESSKKRSWEEILGSSNGDAEKTKGLKRIAIRILAASNFSERNLYSFWLRFFCEKKLQDVGKEFGLSRQRVNQLEKKVMPFFSKPPYPQLTKSFLAGEADLEIILCHMPKPDSEKENFLANLDVYMSIEDENGGGAAQRDFLEVLKEKKRKWRRKIVLYKIKKQAAMVRNKTCRPIL